jgi:HPt (histidine-containing phosphotransfer) domain-containing protein
VVEQAGGTIGFSSKPEEGAQFFFTLPLSGLTAGFAGEPAEDESRLMPPTGLSLLLFLPNPMVADTIESLLEPFGNRLVRAESLAEAEEQASRDTFDAIITGAGEADMLAAAPGAKAPLVAILLRGNRAPNATGNVLRWPVEADLLYGTLDLVCGAKDQTETAGAAIDPEAFSALEKSVGVKTLVEILQCYIATAEQLTTALAQACGEEKWEEASRLAQDIIGAAGGLGLAAVTLAAREFARKARDGENRHELCNAAQAVVGEHLRARQALVHLYPEVA